MSEDLQVYSKANKAAEGFQNLLNRDVDETRVKINTMANNAKYVPVDVVEQLLDELYSGLWQTVNFKYEVVVNEVIGSIDLQVFHPIAKQWISRTGAASVLIQTQKDKPITSEFKIKNTLVKDFPHLKAECLKNAAKSFGCVFGRNLNRGQENDFTYISEKVESITSGTEEAERLLQTAIISDDVREKTARKIRRANDKMIIEIIKYLKGKQ